MGVRRPKGYRCDPLGEAVRSIRLPTEVHDVSARLCNPRPSWATRLDTVALLQKATSAAASTMVRRGGPGASCSARSSAARSWSTGLRTSCPSRQLSVALGELRSLCDGLAGIAAIVLEGLAAYVLVLLFVLLTSVTLEGVALFLLASGSILVRLLAGDADAVGENTLLANLRNVVQRFQKPPKSGRESRAPD